MLFSGQMYPSLATRLSRAPFSGPSAADEGIMPTRYDLSAYTNFLLIEPSTMQAALPNQLQPCCVWSLHGCPCSCHRRRELGAVAIGAPEQGFAMVNADWPGIDYRIGVGPGPIIQYPETFPMRGRAKFGANFGSW